MLNLPRARGDVPHALRIVMTLRLFTPRLRGCTFATHICNFSPFIYPASAGVYPGGWCVRRLRTHLPRARGGVFPMRLTADHLHADLPRAREDVPE